MAKIKFYASTKSIVASDELSLKVNNLEAMLVLLKNTYPALSNILPTCTFLVNGTACENMLHELNDNDLVDVLPQFSGG